MDQFVEHDQLELALRRCGATWNAPQTHGFLCSRISLLGTNAAADWLAQVMAGVERHDAAAKECVAMLDVLFSATWRQLAERQSGFLLLLPEDSRPAAERAGALAHWCEGFLHGLVSGPHRGMLRTRLASEPLSDIIKDMLEITRASASDKDGDEEDEEAYVELVEYIRVAAQLTFEELTEFRAGTAPEPD